MAPAAPPLPQIRASGTLTDDPDAGHVQAPTTPVGALDDPQAGSVFDRYATTGRPRAPPPAAGAIAPAQAYTQPANANGVHYEDQQFLTPDSPRRTGAGGYRQRFADIWPWPLRSSRDANDRPRPWEAASSTATNHTASDVALAAADAEPIGRSPSRPLTRSTTQGDGGRGRAGRNPSNRVAARFNLEGPAPTSARAARELPNSGAPSNLEAGWTATADAHLTYASYVAATDSRNADSAPVRLARLEEDVALFISNSPAVQDGYEDTANSAASNVALRGSSPERRAPGRDLW
ncbi:hypothetical protein BDV10DRAFT_182468 [Aspergillus recurvatus]